MKIDLNVELPVVEWRPIHIDFNLRHFNLTLIK